jgi:two-component system sensor histidine kinase/response regulator
LKYLESIFEHVHLGLAVLDKKGTILESNELFDDFIADKNPIELFNFSPEIESVGEYHAELESGTWLKCRVVPDSGMIYLFVDDISVQKSGEESLKMKARLSEEGKRAAEKATKEKSDFLANMSHEIRTPIHTIIGMTELLRNTKLDQEQSEYTRQVGFSADVLLGLINDILDFSKIEAGKLQLESTTFDLVQVVEQAVDLSSLEAHKKGLETITSIDNSIPQFLLGDPLRLRQIIVNLFNNAVKFTKEGFVKVAVSIEERQEKSILLKFAVRDTGIGIPEEKMSNLFQLFSQVDESTTRKFGGTGLGLAIAKNLTELMDGEVSVSSVHGEGSTFAFTARFDYAMEEKSLYQEASGKLFPGTSVLIVDDNRAVADSIIEVLRAWGCTTSYASGGVEALEILKKGADFDFVFVDLEMPGMDGWRLASEIKDTPGIHSHQLYLMTPAGAGSEEAKMTLLGWFSGYLYKPVRLSDMFHIFSQKKDETKEQAPSSEEPQGVPMFTRHILVAEDHMVNQKLFQTILNAMNYKVVLADNGKEAVEIARQMDIALIFMDVQMPEMNGYEATVLIREEGFTGPIFAVTASALKGEREKCIAVGMTDFLTKPFKQKDIVGILSKYYTELHEDIYLAEVEEVEELEPIEAEETIGETQKENEIVPSDEEQETKTAPIEDETAKNAAGDNLKDRFDYAEALDAFMDEREMLHETLETYLQKTRGQLKQIPGVLKARDFTELRSIAHAVKGSSLNLSVIQTGNVAAELEAAALEENLPQAISLAKSLVAAFKAAAEIIRGSLG